MTCTICRRQGKATKAVRFTRVNLGYCARCADGVDRYRAEMEWEKIEWRDRAVTAHDFAHLHPDAAKTLGLLRPDPTDAA